MQTGSYKPIFENVKPFLIEYMLGTTARYLGWYSIYLFFGVATALSIVLCYKLYRLLGMSTHRSLVLLVSLVFSPIYVGLALIEFKTDIFLFTLVLLNYLLFYKLVATKRIDYYLLISLLSGICILIKLSCIPLALALFLVSLYVVAKYYKTKLLLVHILAVLIFVIPYSLWVSANGATIPMIQKEIGIEKKSPLSVDKNVFQTCQNEATERDYNNYIFGKSFPLILGQPFFYLSGYKMHPEGTQSIATLGPVLYLYILLSILWPLFKPIPKTETEKYFYIVMLAQIIIFYIFIRNIFWYLFPALPLSGYFSFKIFEFYFKSRIRIVAYTLILANALLLVFLYSVFGSGSLPQSNNYIENQDRKFSSYLELNTSDGLILDTSFQQTAVTYPYFVDSSTRVVKANFLFADTQNDQEIYEKIKTNKIHYILAGTAIQQRDINSNSSCINSYFINLKKFLGIHAKIIYSNDLGYSVYKLL